MTDAVALLRTMYTYSAWARDRLLDAVAALTPEQLHAPQTGAYGAIHETLVHMAVSEWMWLQRIQGTSPSPLPTGADFADLQALRAWWDIQHAASLAYLDGLTAADLDQPIHYTNPKGEAFTRRVWQALLHVVNHQTEHRSQVAALLTAAGVAAPPTDLVVYLPQG